MIYVMIRLESPGPALFSPMRYGYAGYFFRCWKFRTMRMNSDKIFEEHMRKNPAETEFWRKHHKLKNDPRVTKFGKLLRRTSLDEIPQLFNVLIGNMSLVGPRPISDKEIAPYGERHNMYVQVRPGITGLWQVSGRSNSEFEERMALDSFYVRNWSPWLDIYLLSRTLKVVLRGEGAY